jgi:3-deoxy-D-manno-octulosonate 8-phosphate phosphatase (KDO 8-P phosphatase)
MKDFSKIRLLVCDCDGVLTDGLIIYGDSAFGADTEIKHFSAHDGLGFQILRHTDIVPVIITARKSGLLKLRCKDLRIKHLYQKVRNKKQCLEDILKMMGLSYENVAYIGDDWNDFLAMKDCAIRIAPKNATHSFQMTVDYVTELAGGYGAVRDAIEYILKGRGEFELALNKFLELCEK